jgi:carboxypeptidase Taq
MNQDYEKYVQQLQKISDVNHSGAVLTWDQEVNMPEKGAEFRARQLATLAGISHEMFISEDFGTLLQKLSKNKKLSQEQARNIEESLKIYKRDKKFTTTFIEERSKAISNAFTSWAKAKEESNYSLFAPYLKKVVEIAREECIIIGFENHPYDALLDIYEPGMTTVQLDQIFEQAKAQLIPFLQKIKQAKQVDDSFMHKHYETEKQWSFGIDLLRQMKYDFDAGRQDISSHPFTINFNPQDVRITTRINENDLAEMIWSTLHECGHALYEQGLRTEYYGLPLGEAASLAIHESQSRLWENNVGRSFSYWKSNYPSLHEYFPKNLLMVTVKDFYKAMNKVQPSLIRTSADELTYHFHVIIRYEIEKDLIAGNIQVADLPAVWNKKYKDYLGLDVPTDREGVLQDVHWSHGSFGYFPTYSLGSFYAAQLFNKASQEIKNLEEYIAKGDLQPLHDWLKVNVYYYGKMYSATDLCEKITGEKLNFNYFMSYAHKKYAEIYELTPQFAPIVNS